MSYVNPDIAGHLAEGKTLGEAVKMAWGDQSSPTISPAELLDREVVLDPTQTAYVLGRKFTRGPRKGQPDPARALALVRAGHLRPVDPTVATRDLTISCAEVRRYLAAANNKGEAA